MISLLFAALLMLPTLGDLKAAHKENLQAIIPSSQLPELTPYTYTEPGQSGWCSDYAMTIALNVVKKYPGMRDKIFFYEGYVGSLWYGRSYHAVTVFRLNRKLYVSDNLSRKLKHIDEVSIDWVRWRPIFEGKWHGFIRSN